MILGICPFCKKEFRKRTRTYKFCSLICSNRFNLNHKNEVILPKKNVNLAEFIGICLGDGCVTKYQTSITLNSIVDYQYLPYVVSLAKKLFQGATVSVMPNKRENSTDVRVNSITVATFLRDMGIISNAKYVPAWILANSEYTKACIRGLFDTEGSISFKQYVSKKGISIYKQLNFRNANISLMTFVRDNLINLGLKPTITLKRSLYLSNDRSIDTFRQIIGFSNPKLLKRSLISDIDAYSLLDVSSSIQLDANEVLR